MALTAGTRLGVYEITGPLGVGGMGEVYRATDTQLRRDVAIKVLPASFADDADRLARFKREAEVLASLNHPNIAHIYGLERGDGTTALVMELVEGPTLAERIAQGPVPPDEALHIAMQIADALEAAHGRGIVHRDLKPANIKVTPEGLVKVLDFGIAKAVEAQALSGPQSPSLTTPAMTQAGILLGTAAYMAPEQARGKPVDQRADIWAFGCVLYEVLTGQPAFGGEDVPMTLARVLANDTDLKTMPGTIAPAVRHTIKLCLEKDARKRIADVRDVKLALAGAFETQAPLAEGVRSKEPSAPSRRWLLPAAVLLVGAIVLISAPWHSAAVLPELRLAVNLPNEIVTASRFGQRPGDFALSPDGRFLAIAASGEGSSGESSRLWLWHLDSREVRPLPGAERAYRPFWSTDSRFVFFSTGDGELKKVDVVGGPAQTLVGSGVAGFGRGGGSSRGDAVLFGNTDLGFSLVSANSDPKVLTAVRGSREHDELPVLLPDGKHFLYFRHTFRPETQGIYLGSTEAEPSEQPSAPLILADDGPVLVEDADAGGSYLLFMRERTLLAQPFDVEERALHGEPVPVAADVEGGAGNGWTSASADGRLLVFREGVYTDFRSAPKTLVWVDRGGVETTIPAPPRDYRLADISPDGRHIALRADDGLWIWDIERETMTRLTNDLDTRGLAWTPDSRRVAFVAGDDVEAYWQSADGASPAQPLGFSGMPVDISADGHVLYQPSVTEVDIFMRSVADPSDAPTPLLATAADERAASVSPNGQFVVYQSNESGRAEVYVRPFPDVSAARWQISTNGGTRPQWRADGREIYYYVGAEGLDQINDSFGSGALMAVSIDLEPGFRAGVPQQLFAGDYVAASNDGHAYDVTPDGQRFLMIKLAGAIERSQPQLVFAQNWLAPVKRRLADAGAAD